MEIITLLTDFGTQDEYVGVMKGVMLGINPGITIVDLNHQISPQDIMGAAYMLRASFGYFPEGSLHLAIVDPGVGSQRAILAARFQSHRFLAPDNGLLPVVWADEKPDEIVRVENRELFGQSVSSTFHGRDIFAPVAAHLAKGKPLKIVGSTVETSQLRRLKNPSVVFDRKVGLEGRIVAIDRFGNLITNIEIMHLDQLRRQWLTDKLMTVVGRHHIRGLTTHYAESPNETAVALIGSRNCLEIAVNCGNAAKLLQANRGDVVHVRPIQS